jgi:hypothetical protein
VPAEFTTGSSDDFSLNFPAKFISPCFNTTNDLYIRNIDLKFVSKTLVADNNFMFNILLSFLNTKHDTTSIPVPHIHTVAPSWQGQNLLWIAWFGATAGTTTAANHHCFGTLTCCFVLLESHRKAMMRFQRHLAWSRL